MYLFVAESEVFDLAGSNATTIESTIRDAFSEPFPLQEMIRLTFVTGAGKLGRARYDDNAAKAVTSTLRDLGYEEDRGASAVLECAGSFKLQHDTGKNLKTVVVFPKVSSATGVEGAMGELGMNDTASFVAEGTTEHKIAHTSMNVFPRMIDSMCPTWSQKKGCVTAINELIGMAGKLDEKLMQGEPLTDPEQEFYDSVSMTSLQEKLACVRELMHKQVEDGKITKEERQQLIEQVCEKLEKLASDIGEAEKEGKVKRVENLKVAETKAEARKEKLQSTKTVSPPPLKNENELAKLRKEMKPLLEIEVAAKGRLLTLKESQSIARKDEILEEIIELEEASRGWFESDEAFEARVEASRASWEANNKKTAKKKPSGGASAGKSALPATTKWVTPGASKGGAWSKPAAKKKQTGSGGLFAAMMNDSDSD